MNSLENRASAGPGACLPPPRRLPSIALNSIEHIRAEQARLYRDARAGRVDIGAASRLTWMLSELVKTSMAGRIEQRLDALENGGALALLTDDTTHGEDDGN